jgi:hypothetical protein
MAAKRQSARLSQKVSINAPSKALSFSSHLAKYKNDIQVKSPPVDEATTTTTSPPAVKATKTRKVKPAGDAKLKNDPSKPIEPPENWKSVYEAIKEYRKTALAPVDTMGCERLGDVTAGEKVTLIVHSFITLHPLITSSCRRLDSRRLCRSCYHHKPGILSRQPLYKA